MSRIEAALKRVTGALDRLEEAIDMVETADPEETQRLQEEIEVLRTRAQEDARLRAEAAGAVREALRDLRGAMMRGGQPGEQANA